MCCRSRSCREPHSFGWACRYRRMEAPPLELDSSSSVIISFFFFCCSVAVSFIVSSRSSVSRSDPLSCSVSGGRHTPDNPRLRKDLSRTASIVRGLESRAPESGKCSDGRSSSNRDWERKGEPLWDVPLIG